MMKTKLFLSILLIIICNKMYSQVVQDLGAVQIDVNYKDYKAKFRPYFYYFDLDLYRWDVVLGKSLSPNVDLYAYFKTDEKQNHRLGPRIDFKYLKAVKASTQFRYYWGLNNGVKNQINIITTLGRAFKRLPQVQFGIRQHYTKTETKVANSYLGPDLLILPVKYGGFYIAAMRDLYREEYMVFGILYFNFRISEKQTQTE